MPIYRYTCESCGARFEKIRSMSTTDLSTCRCVCGKDAARTLTTSRWYLRQDGTQRGGGWSKPGMSGIDYSKKDTKYGFRGNHMMFHNN